MNAHNEQHDPASAVVKQNLTTQPAAAQEAVGWQWRWLDTDNTWSEWVDGGSRKEIDARIARWKADGEDHRMQVRPLFAAPVTAAPVVDPSRLGAAMTAFDAAGGHAVRYAPEWMRKALEAASIPAAPGIDMGVPGATLTIEGKTFTVDEVRAALLPDASPKGGSDPWRGLYAPERAPNRDEYGCFYHPDIPSWDDEREESIAPLLKAQGFDLQCVPGDFSDEAMEEGGERYWQEMREWSPEPEGDGWRLVAIYDTEDGPYSMFVKPLAHAGDAEVQP